MFPALPGKVPENWVGLARWGCRVRTGRFGEEIPLGTQRVGTGIGNPALWLLQNPTVQRLSFGLYKPGLCPQLSELPPGLGGWAPWKEGWTSPWAGGQRGVPTGKGSLAPFQRHALLRQPAVMGQSLGAQACVAPARAGDGQGGCFVLPLRVCGSYSVVGVGSEAAGPLACPCKCNG